MAVASMVLGIIALLFSVFGFGVASWIGCILAILAIIFASVSKKKNDARKGMSSAGLAMGIVALVIGVLETAACFGCAAAFTSSVDELKVYIDNPADLIDELNDVLEEAQEALKRIEI